MGVSVNKLAQKQEKNSSTDGTDLSKTFEVPMYYQKINLGTNGFRLIKILNLVAIQDLYICIVFLYT